MLTDPQWSTVGLALSMMSSYNLQNVQGIMNKINALQSLIYNPDFTYVSGVISKNFVELLILYAKLYECIFNIGVPDSDAQDFYNSFATSISATKGLVQSYENILGLNKTVIMQQQEDKSGYYHKHFLVNCYKFYIFY